MTDLTFPFREMLDISEWRGDARRIVNEAIVPELLTPLVEGGIDVEIGFSLDIVNSFQESRPKMLMFPALDATHGIWTDRDKARVIVATIDRHPIGLIAARRIWCERGLSETLRTYSAEGDYWIIKSPLAEEIRCCNVALRGSAWVDPEYRNNRLYSRISRLLDLILLADWRWTYRIALVTPDKVSKLGFTTYGYLNGSPRIYRGKPDVPIEDREYYLLAARRDHFAEMLIRPETGDVTKPLGFPSHAEIEAARSEA